MKATPIDSASSHKKPPQQQQQVQPQQTPAQLDRKPIEKVYSATALDDCKVTIDSTVADSIESLAQELVAAKNRLEDVESRLQTLLLDNNLKGYKTAVGTAWLRSGTRDTINVPALVAAGIDYETIGRAAWGVNKQQLVESGIDEQVIAAATTSKPWVAAGVTDYSKKKDGKDAGE